MQKINGLSFGGVYGEVNGEVSEETPPRENPLVQGLCALFGVYVRIFLEFLYPYDFYLNIKDTSYNYYSLS